MPLFRYEATDAAGQIVRGAMQVEAEEAVAPRLEAMGYKLVQVEPTVRPLHAAAARTRATGAAGTAPRAAAGGASGLTAPERELARMFHQLHLSFRAGMTPAQAAANVAGQVPHPALRQTLTEIAAGAREGRSLSEQMAAYPRLFGPGDVGLIAAGERAGTLPEALELIARRREEDENARGRLRLWVWLLHSNVFAVLLFIPVAFFLKEVFPSFDPRAGLAGAARAFLLLSVPLGVAYGLALRAAARARTDPARRGRWDRLLLRLRGLRRVHEARAKAVFTRSLAWQWNAGVAPGTAWETAAAAVPNTALAERFTQGLPAVEGTGRPSAGLQLSGMMDATDVGLVLTGESTGEIPQALGYLADRCEDEAGRALQDAVTQGRFRMILWGFLIGALGMCLFYWGYFGGVMKLMDGFE